MPGSHNPQQNHLLAALSPVEQDRLYPHLRLVPMPLGKVLYESGDLLRHVYFPTDSIVSLLYVLADGASAEISVVGNEGLIGIALFMGGETTPSRAIVQSAGHAYRLIGQQLKDEFHRNGEMQLLLLRYTQSLITQMAQTAVCNRHHSVDQQLCRWLLLSLDRLSSNQLTMTQELIANMLGVRREGVTEAAGKLHKLGVIRYARGPRTSAPNVLRDHGIRLRFAARHARTIAEVRTRDARANVRTRSAIRYVPSKVGRRRRATPIPIHQWVHSPNYGYAAIAGR